MSGSEDDWENSSNEDDKKEQEDKKKFEGEDEIDPEILKKEKQAAIKK